MQFSEVRRHALTILAVLLLAACDPLFASFSPEAYKNATSLKARSLSLIDRSGTPYSSLADQVETLMTDIDAAYEYSNGLPNNEISAQQWIIMRSPEEGLMGDFVAFWKENSTTRPFYREEKKKQVAQGFDYIICLEVNKQKASACSDLKTN